MTHLGRLMPEIREYTYQETVYEYQLLEANEFNTRMDETFPQFTWLRRRLTRGFRINQEIIIKENARIGLNRLILHEIGHLLGYKHTWKLTLMNPSWVFRWFKRF